MLLVKIAGAIALPMTTLVSRQLDTTCPAAPRCPQNNGCNHTAINGAGFMLNCFTDYDGQVVEIVRGRSPSDCETACALSEACHAVNVKKDSPASESAFCYLLGPRTGASRTASNVHAGLKTKSATSAQQSDGSYACPGSRAVKCPLDDGCAATIAGKRMVVKCKTDFYGADFADSVQESFHACVHECAGNQRCRAVAYRNRTCWLKSSVPVGLYSVGVEGAYVG